MNFKDFIAEELQLNEGEEAKIKTLLSGMKSDLMKMATLAGRMQNASTDSKQKSDLKALEDKLDDVRQYIHRHML